MDIRIGVTQAPRELSIEVPDEQHDEVAAAVDAVLAGASDVLWLTDKRGRRFAVPGAKIAYVEIGTSESAPRIGFGG